MKIFRVELKRKNMTCFQPFLKNKGLKKKKKITIEAAIQSRGVFRRRCSENMQQIYRRTPMPK